MPTPLAPENFEVMSQIQECITTNDLHWDDPSPEGNPVDYYEIQLKQTGGNWEALTEVVGTSFPHVLLTPGQLLIYRIRGVNGSGASGWVNLGCVSAGTIIPDRPTNIYLILDDKCHSLRVSANTASNMGSGMPELHIRVRAWDGNAALLSDDTTVIPDFLEPVTSFITLPHGAMYTVELRVKSCDKYSEWANLGLPGTTTKMSAPSQVWIDQETIVPNYLMRLFRTGRNTGSWVNPYPQARTRTVYQAYWIRTTVRDSNPFQEGTLIMPEGASVLEEISVPEPPTGVTGIVVVIYGENAGGTAVHQEESSVYPIGVRG